MPTPDSKESTQKSDRMKPLTREQNTQLFNQAYGHKKMGVGKKETLELLRQGWGSIASEEKIKERIATAWKFSPGVMAAILAVDNLKPAISGSDRNFELVWETDDFSLIARVRRLKEHSDGKIAGRLEIRSTFPGTPAKLYQAMFTFSGGRSQSTLAKTLAGRTPLFAQETWNRLVDQLCEHVFKIIDEGEPVLEISSQKPIPFKWIINLLVPAGDPVVFYGKPGSGKSFLAQAMALAIESGEEIGEMVPTEIRHVLYLDWETRYDELSRRLFNLSQGAHIALPGILYRHCFRSLADDIEKIQSLILEKGINFIIIDSLGPACGPDLTASEGAIEFFNALRSLKLPAIIVAHRPKNQQASSIYGSVFFEILARSIYEVEAYQDAVNSNLHLALYHRKTNSSQLQHPHGYRLIFDTDSVVIESEDLRDIPEAQAKRPLASRIRELLLDAGMMDVKDIASSLDKPAGTIRKTLNRMRDEGMTIKLANNNWGVKTDDIPPL